MNKWRTYFQNYHREHVVVALPLLAVLLFLVFFGKYYWNHSGLRPVDVSGTSAPSEEYVFGVDECSIYEEDYVKITGWAVKQGENIEINEAYLVLQDTETGVFYQAATSVIERSDVNDMLEDEYDYLNSGLYAVVRISEMPENVHIYILYKNNGDNTLLDTGVEYTLED